VRQLTQFYRLYDPSQLPLPIAIIAYYTPPAELSPSLIAIAHQEQERELNATLRGKYGVDLESMRNYLQYQGKAGDTTVDSGPLGGPPGGAQAMFGGRSPVSTSGGLWAGEAAAGGGSPLANLI
jgi:hypothetical protein